MNRWFLDPLMGRGYPEELKETKRITAFRDFIVSKAKEWSF